MLSDQSLRQSCWLKSAMTDRTLVTNAVSWHAFLEDEEYEMGFEYQSGSYASNPQESDPRSCEDQCLAVPICVGFTWYSEFEGCT